MTDPITPADLAFSAALLGGASHEEAIATARSIAQDARDLYRTLAQHLPAARALSEAAQGLRKDSPLLPLMIKDALADHLDVAMAFGLGPEALRIALRAHAYPHFLAHGSHLMGVRPKTGAPPPIAIASVANALLRQAPPTLQRAVNEALSAGDEKSSAKNQPIPG